MTKKQAGYQINTKDNNTLEKVVIEIACKLMEKVIKELEYEKGIKKTGVKDIFKLGLGFKGEEVKLVFEKQQRD